MVRGPTCPLFRFIVVTQGLLSSGYFLDHPLVHLTVFFPFPLKSTTSSSNTPKTNKNLAT
jgi:hypothetical protein